MKRVIGFAAFFIAIGMILMMILNNNFIGFILVCILLMAGYHLFCCD